ncbi:MAG: hypothetical protein CFH39_00912, partial [Alphaproteobacteria bacterium MarineAlpha10_Bin2]
MSDATAMTCQPIGPILNDATERELFF